jgi:hypothetical protein
MMSHCSVTETVQSSPQQHRKIGIEALQYMEEQQNK